jgi:hypothetical protein
MWRPPRRPRLPATVWLAVLAFVTMASPALAHEGEEAVPARTQVQVAVAILRTQPDLVDLAADRIKDATEAKNKQGVDVDRVEQAKKTLDAGDLAATELLLEQALGSCPGEPVTNPVRIRGQLPAKPCPAPAPHELAIGRIRPQGATRASLLAIGALLVLGGLVLARRVR